jgi:hypothetical protein
MASGLCIFFGILAWVRRADCLVVIEKTPHWAAIAGVLACSGVDWRALDLKSARYLLGIAGIISHMPFIYRPLILLAPDHARILARDGWTKNDVREYLHLHCCVTAEQYWRSGRVDSMVSAGTRFFAV